MFGISRKEHIRIWEQLCTDTKTIRQLAENVRHLEKYFGDDILILGRRVRGLTEARDRIWGRLDDIDKYLQRNPPIQKTNSDNSTLQYYRQRIGALRERLEDARIAIGNRDQRIKTLEEGGAMADKIENALHNEIAERDARIRSLLEEIRAKNVTIARLQGAEVRIESSGEPEIPCQS